MESIGYSDALAVVAGSVGIEKDAAGIVVVVGYYYIDYYQLKPAVADAAVVGSA